MPSPIAHEDVRFSVQQIVGFLIVALALVEYSTLWLYPDIRPEILFSAQSDALGRATSSITRTFGAQFRLLLWLVFCAGFACFFLTRSISSLISVLGPYLAFIVFAIFSAIAGDNPGNSLWFVAQWLVMASAAAVAGQLCSATTIKSAGEYVFAFGAFGSLLLAVAAPSMAISASGGSMLLHGLFAGKNLAGWFACLGFIWIYAFRTQRLSWFSCASLLALLMVLVWSGSKTSLAVLMVSIAYYYFVCFVQRLRMHWISAAFITAATVGTLMVAAQVLLPIIIEALGKDPTLTGRTAIWSSYLRFMQDDFWFGKGAGAFAFASELTQRVAETMEEGQRVYGVHNMYLALFGDTGFVGAAFNVIALIYILLVPVYRDRGPGHTAASVVALTILISGFSEAHEHIVPGNGTFALLVMRSSAIRLRASVAGRNARLPANPYFKNGRTHYAGANRSSQLT